MGTRHLICVMSGGKYRIAQYGQWDGYPSGQGLAILGFLESPMAEQLKKNLGHCAWISNEEYDRLWKKFDVEPKEPYVDYDVYKEFCAAYPQLCRDTGAGILGLAANSTGEIKLRDSLDFSKDSLFCEWAYVIDFDKNTFEVYQGFNEMPLEPSERFYTAEQKEDENGMYPVKLVQAFDLSKLPTENEFLEICEAADEELDEEWDEDSEE